jgi:hypothetical protein
LQVQGKKAIEIKTADVAELVDARDLKSLDGNVVWVRVPPPAPNKERVFRRTKAMQSARGSVRNIAVAQLARAHALAVAGR